MNERQTSKMPRRQEQQRPTGDFLIPTFLTLALVMDDSYGIQRQKKPQESFPPPSKPSPELLAALQQQSQDYRSEQDFRHYVEKLRHLTKLLSQHTQSWQWNKASLKNLTDCLNAVQQRQDHLPPRAQANLARTLERQLGKTRSGKFKRLEDLESGLETLAQSFRGLPQLPERTAALNALKRFHKNPFGKKMDGAALEDLVTTAPTPQSETRWFPSIQPSTVIKAVLTVAGTAAGVYMIANGIPMAAAAEVVGNATDVFSTTLVSWGSQALQTAAQVTAAGTPAVSTLSLFYAAAEQARSPHKIQFRVTPLSHHRPAPHAGQSTLKPAAERSGVNTSPQECHIEVWDDAGCHGQTTFPTQHFEECRDAAGQVKHISQQRDVAFWHRESQGGVDNTAQPYKACSLRMHCPDGRSLKIDLAYPTSTVSELPTPLNTGNDTLSITRPTCTPTASAPTCLQATYTNLQGQTVTLQQCFNQPRDGFQVAGNLFNGWNRFVKPFSSTDASPFSTTPFSAAPHTVFRPVTTLPPTNLAPATNGMCPLRLTDTAPTLVNPIPHPPSSYVPVALVAGAAATAAGAVIKVQRNLTTESKAATAANTVASEKKAEKQTGQMRKGFFHLEDQPDHKVPEWFLPFCALMPNWDAIKKTASGGYTFTHSIQGEQGVTLHAPSAGTEKNLTLDMGAKASFRHNHQDQISFCMTTQGHAEADLAKLYRATLSTLVAICRRAESHQQLQSVVVTIHGPESLVSQIKCRMDNLIKAYPQLQNLAFAYQDEKKQAFTPEVMKTWKPGAVVTVDDTLSEKSKTTFQTRNQRATLFHQAFDPIEKQDWHTLLLKQLSESLQPTATPGARTPGTAGIIQDEPLASSSPRVGVR